MGVTAFKVKVVAGVMGSIAFVGAGRIVGAIAVGLVKLGIRLARRTERVIDDFEANSAGSASGVYGAEQLGGDELQQAFWRILVDGDVISSDDALTHPPARDIGLEDH